MNVLYLITCSPFQRTEPYLDFELAEKGDAILFLQCGVNILKNPGDTLKNLVEKGVKIYAGEECLRARAIKSDDKNFEIVDYDGIADLILKYKQTVVC